MRAVTAFSARKSPGVNRMLYLRKSLVVPLLDTAARAPEHKAVRNVHRKSLRRDGSEREKYHRIPQRGDGHQPARRNREQENRRGKENEIGSVRDEVQHEKERPWKSTLREALKES